MKGYIVQHQRNINIYGFNDHFYLKQKIAVSTKKNFKSKTSKNENQVEINYLKTPNKLNSKIRCNSKISIASAKLRLQTLEHDGNYIILRNKSSATRWRSYNTLDSYSGGPELKFWCRQIIYNTTIETHSRVVGPIHLKFLRLE